ncbi:F510_1955 family glycosylhydrolase [Lentibacillus juripiscarius]|uniref:F510_1955 family glycosylhydrolase n=1 Tax=Lentibacillus juripiscarius TaxID=257446 RepID=A0ABW5V6D7_9BACI
MIKKAMITVTIFSGLLIAGCSSNDGNKEAAFEVPFDGSIEHVHGMGYAGNDNGLYFASHTGLKIYREDEWFKTSNNFNDYMGFNAVDEGFYTSGHPGEDSDLPNPIGIQRSFDGGKTLESLKFEGETDFHAMAVGYNSHDIFVMNPAKNSKLEQGFYKSQDEGESWESVNASGLEGEIFALAIHPSDSNHFAVATTNGVFVSNDGGSNFQIITEAVQGTAVFFNEENLYYASYSTSPSLVKYNIESGKQETINLPDLTEDGPVYIAQNPQDNQEFAIYTTKGQAYITKDGAESWDQILENGKVN